MSAPGLLDAIQLAAGDDVKAAAGVVHQLEDAEIRVRLDRVTNHRVHGRERRLNFFEASEQRRLGINPTRRPKLLGQLGHRLLLAEQFTFVVMEVVHDVLQ